MPTTPGSTQRRAATQRSTMPAPVRAHRATIVTTDTAAPTPRLDQLLTTAEVGRRLGLDARTVRRYITEYRILPGYRVGRGYRVDPRHLDAYLARVQVGTEAVS